MFEGDGSGGPQPHPNASCSQCAQPRISSGQGRPHEPFTAPTGRRRGMTKSDDGGSLLLGNILTGRNWCTSSIRSRSSECWWTATVLSSPLRRSKRIGNPVAKDVQRSSGSDPETASCRPRKLVSRKIRSPPVSPSVLWLKRFWVNRLWTAPLHRLLSRSMRLERFGVG